MNLPELSGTGRQIERAKRARDTILSQTAETMRRRFGSDPRLKEAVKQLIAVKEASWWIEHEHADLEDLLLIFVARTYRGHIQIMNTPALFTHNGEPAIVPCQCQKCREGQVSQAIVFDGKEVAVQTKFGFVDVSCAAREKLVTREQVRNFAKRNKIYVRKFSLDV